MIDLNELERLEREDRAEKETLQKKKESRKPMEGGNPITDFGKGVVTGITHRVPEMVGEAAEYVGMDWGKDLKEWARKDDPRPEDPGMFYQAGEMTPASAAIPMGMRAAGTALRLIPHPVAQGAGWLLQVAPFVVTPALFGLSQAQSTKETAEKAGVDPGTAPIKTGLIEGTLESVGTFAFMRLLGPLAPVANAAKAPVKALLKDTLKTYTKRLGLVTMPTEIGTEMAQQAGEAQVEKSAGIRPDAKPIKEAMSVIGPTAIMTVVMGGAGHVYQQYEGARMQKALEDPETDSTARMQAAGKVAGIIQMEEKKTDKDTPLANLWMHYAKGQIDEGRAIELDASATETVNKLISQGKMDARKVLDEDVPEDQRGKSAKQLLTGDLGEEGGAHTDAELDAAINAESGADTSTSGQPDPSKVEGEADTEGESGAEQVAGVLQEDTKVEGSEKDPGGENEIQAAMKEYFPDLELSSSEGALDYTPANVEARWDLAYTAFEGGYDKPTETAIAKLKKKKKALQGKRDAESKEAIGQIDAEIQALSEKAGSANALIEAEAIDFQERVRALIVARAAEQGLTFDEHVPEDEFTDNILSDIFEPRSAESLYKTPIKEIIDMEIEGAKEHQKAQKAEKENETPEGHIEKGVNPLPYGMSWKEFAEAKGQSWPIKTSDDAYPQLKADYDAYKAAKPQEQAAGDVKPGEEGVDKGEGEKGAQRDDIIGKESKESDLEPPAPKLTIPVTTDGKKVIFTRYTEAQGFGQITKDHPEYERLRKEFDSWRGSDMADVTPDAMMAKATKFKDDRRKLKAGPKKKANRGHAKNLLARLAQDKVAFGKDYQETISLEAMYKTDKELLTVDEIAAFREKEEKEKAKSIDSTPKKEDNEDDKKKEAPDGRLPADSKSTPGEDKPESGESPEGSKKDGELSGRDHESDTGGGRNDLQSDEEGRPSGRPDKEGGDSEHAEDAGAGSSDESNERVSKQSGRVTNYHITDADQVGEGGWKQKAKDNVAAIRALKTILKENRPATLAEQALLVKYVGWGASDLANNIFPQKEYSYEKHQSEDVYRTGWKALGEELKSLLSEEEYSQAKRSTLNAHYTSPEVIKAMYAALESFGFKGGRMLEPGCGIGHFVGLMPAGMRGDTKFTGVELDGTSAAIAKLLYPEESIHQADFIKFNRPDGFYDAVIGNPPFSSTAITQDKRYEKYKFPLHDYFFAKGMDKLRPGGLMMLVTSRYTMDKEGDRLRKYLSKQADLLGAIRLPQTAFKQNAGTDVVTDVIFLRKRMEGEAPAGESWAGIKEVKTRDGKTSVNEYFATHPQMVLGTHRLTGSMYGGSSYTVTPPQGTTIGAAFEKATENLPKGIYQKEKVLSVADEPTIEYDLAPDHIKEDAYYVDDKDALLIKVDGVGKPLGGKVGQKIIRSFVKVRDAVRMVLYIQSKEDVNEKDLAKAQKELSAAYDAFVKAHGHINKRTVVTMKNGDESVRYPNISPFRNDPDAYLVASIEKYNDETGEVKKTDIFTKRVIRPDIEPKIETVEDALNVSLVNKGYVDIEDIASLAGMTKDAAIDSLRGAIFRNPNKQKWETADAYLSGNVREKLTDARLAAEEDETYKPNVEALEEVQPADLSPSQMTVTLGMPIVKPEYIVSFANEVLTLNGLQSRFIAQTGTWVLTNEYGGSLAGYRGVAATSEWGTGDRTSAELLESALNNRQVTVTRRDSDGKTYTDKVATVAANEKMQKIKKAFLKWVWESPDRAEDIAKDYNERYNNSINRSFDGPYIDRMTFPGMSSLITPYRHQKRVAWRIVQQGNTYMAHSVGAGKTIASIMAAMEMKRLGIKKKPAWVVPNHMLKQFSSEFLQLYPAAKLLVADEENFSKVQRNRFMGRVAAENWDGVIITHSAFGKMQVQPQFMADSIREMLDELEMVLDTVDHSERATRKQIERQKEKLEARLTKLAEGEGKDRGVSFEETGIDMIIVDEAQEFRKLDFITNQSTIKGIDPNGSLRAWDLYIKGKYLESLTPGRSMVLMSGTPVTNTLGEVYTIQRYLTEDLLRKNHLDNFDSWASTFGDLVTNVEAGPGGYKAVTRFAEFTNMEVLGKMWGDIGDYIRVKDLPYITLPEVDTGGRKVVAVDQTATQKRYKEVLKERVRHIENRTGRPQRGDDIILSVITDGRHAAIDERYIDPSLPPNPESKLEVMIDNVHEIWERTKADKSTQMIFSDLGVPGSEGRRGFSAYNRIKERLIELGVPANEIAFMQDYKKSQAKQDLFKRMKTGQVRVLIGSSQAMGTGVNAQDLLVALHHLDPDNYLPAWIEQREGRIVRQGNKNKMVDLFAYVTKGSHDETMWQFLETKQRFIDQFLAGKATEARTSDIDGAADSYAFAKALSSDNPLWLEKAGLENELNRLHALARAHMDDQLAMRRRIKNANQDIPDLERAIEAHKKVAAMKKDISGDKFVFVVGGKKYTERAKAGEAFLSMLNKVIDPEAKNHFVGVGEIAGIPLNATAATVGFGDNGAITGHNIEVGIRGAVCHISIVPGQSPQGIITKLENAAKGFDRSSTVTLPEALEKMRHELKRAEAQVGRPFEYQAALDEKKARIEQIDKELVITEAAEAAAALEEGLDSVQESAVRYTHENAISEQLDLFKGSLSGGGGNNKPFKHDASGPIQPDGQPEVVSVLRGYFRGGKYAATAVDIAQIGEINLVKYPNERLLAVLTDKNDKILNILDHSRGTRGESSADHAEIAAQALGAKGAANLWLVHQHPAGDPTLSDADKSFFDAVDNALRGTSVAARDIIAVVKGAHSSRRRLYDNRPTPPGVQTIGKIKRVVREWKNTGTSDVFLSSDQHVREFAKKHLPDGGIILGDSRNRPVATYKPESYEFLRGKAQEDLLKEAEKRNARTMFVFEPKIAVDTDNIMKFANALKLSVQDVIDITGSAANNDYYGFKRSRENASLNFLSVGDAIPTLDEVQTGELQEIAKEIWKTFTKILPDDAMRRIGLELRPFITTKGKDLRKSLEMHGDKETPQNILGATSFKGINALIELCYAYDKGTIEKTAFHEAFHVAARWVLPASDHKAIMNYYKGNEEDAAEAFATSAMKWKKEGIKHPDTIVKRAFLKLLRIVERLRNYLTGRGYMRPQDVFAKLYTGQYNTAKTGTGSTSSHLAVGQKLREADVPIDNVEPKTLDATGSHAKVIARAGEEFNSWPDNIIAADGSEIFLHNPERGSLGARAKHLIWNQDKDVLHLEKLRWLPNVQSTLENAAVRIVDHRNGNRIYVRAYKGDTKHMVVVNPKGAVKEQMPFKGNLITQFPYAEKGVQNSMVIEWKREKGEGSLQEGPNPSRTDSTSLGPDRLVKINITPSSKNVKGKSTKENNDTMLRVADATDALPGVVRERMDAARGVPKADRMSGMKEWGQKIKHGFYHFPGLATIEDVKLRAKLKDILRLHQEIPETAKDMASRKILDFIGELKGKQDYEDFRTTLVLADLVRDLDNEVLIPGNGAWKEEGPFGFKTGEEVRAAYAAYQQKAKDNPKLDKALKARKEFIHGLTKELVEHKILKPEALQSDDYFHHQVIAYWGETKGSGTSSKDVRKHWRGWMAARKGSILDYNTEYTEAEFSAVAQQIAQIETAKTLKRIDAEANVLRDLKSEAKAANLRNYLKIAQTNPLEDPLGPYKKRIAMARAKLAKMAADGDLEYDSEWTDLVENLAASHEEDMDFNDSRWFPFLSYLIDKKKNGSNWAATIYKAIHDRNTEIETTLGDAFLTYRDVIPEGYAEWMPDPKKGWFWANTVADNVVQDVIAGVRGLEDKEVRRVLAKGQNTVWVIPEGLAEVLDNFRGERGEDTLLGSIARKSMAFWKQYILINPFSVLKYNINNASGDTDVCIAYAPSILKGAAKATKDMIAWHKMKMPAGDLRRELEEARRGGVIGSGFSVQEVEDVLKIMSMDKFVRNIIAGEKLNVAQKYWKSAQQATACRENILRLAAYRWFKEQIKAGKRVYGASLPKDIDAITDVNEKAAKLARELLGDYGNLSKHGECLRARIIPFYSWLEINAPRYVYMLRNLKHEDGESEALKGVSLVAMKKTANFMLKASLLYMLISLYNSIVWPDEEDELGEAGRRQMHLILGRREDGSIISMRFQGALSDALSFFGAEDLPSDYKDLTEGKSTIQEKMMEIPKALATRVIQGIRPDVKMFKEVLTGEATYPDPFSPRPIRDTYEHVLKTFKLDIPYRYIKGKPKRGDGWVEQFANDLKKMLVYESDPGEQAYYDTRNMIFKWQEKNGKERSYGKPTKKGNALYYYRQALKYGDLQAAQKYKRIYIEEFGGTEKGITKGIKSAHPLSGIPKKDRYGFRRSLSPKDDEIVRRGIEWYKTTYIK